MTQPQVGSATSPTKSSNHCDDVPSNRTVKLLCCYMIYINSHHVNNISSYVLLYPKPTNPTRHWRHKGHKTPNLRPPAELSRLDGRESCRFLGTEWHGNLRKKNIFNTTKTSYWWTCDRGISKNSGTPKMDGENNGKPYWNGWFGGTTIFGNTHTFTAHEQIICLHRI